MKNRKPVLLLFVLFILFMACNTVSFEKRRYNSGYYVDISKRAKPTRKGNEPFTNNSFSVAKTHPSDSLNILGNAPNYAATKKNAIRQLNEVPKSALAKKLPHENKISFEKSIHSPQSNANDNYSHKKAIKELGQKYYQENKEEIKERMQKYHQEHKDDTDVLKEQYAHTRAAVWSVNLVAVDV